MEACSTSAGKVWVPLALIASASPSFLPFSFVPTARSPSTGPSATTLVISALPLEVFLTDQVTMELPVSSSHWAQPSRLNDLTGALPLKLSPGWKPVADAGVAIAATPPRPIIRPAAPARSRRVRECDFTQELQG